MLIHLIYASAATQEFSKEELVDLLSRARQFNSDCKITGMLLHSEGSFFQILEGPEQQVDALFQHIQSDSRHSRITEIIREPIAKRSFEDWSMAFAGASQSELSRIDGLNDFFDSGNCLADLDPGRSKKLLTAFAKGHWRSHLR